MHIVLLNTGGGTGGIEAYLSGAARYLVESGHEVTMAVPVGGLLTRATACGARPFPLPIASKFDLRSALALSRFLERHPADIVNAQQERTLLIALAARAMMRRGSRPRVLQTEHNRTVDRLRCDRATREMRLSTLALHRFLARSCDGFLGVSEAVCKFLIEIERVPFRRTAVTPLGVDPLTVRPSLTPQAAREKFALDPGKLIVTSIAKLKLQKDIVTLLEAAAIVLAKNSEIEFVLAGDGPEEGRLRQLAERLGIARSVRFLGFCDDVPNLLAASDIFLLTSRWEGMPRVVLEAMAASKPVIATAVSGTPEQVVNEVTGLLVPPLDPASTAQALQRLIYEPQLRAQMGHAGFERILSHFEERDSIQRLIEAYRRLCPEVDWAPSRARREAAIHV